MDVKRYNPEMEHFFLEIDLYHIWYNILNMDTECGEEIERTAIFC